MGKGKSQKTDLTQKKRVELKNKWMHLKKKLGETSKDKKKIYFSISPTKMGEFQKKWINAHMSGYK